MFTGIASLVTGKFMIASEPLKKSWKIYVTFVDTQPQQKLKFMFWNCFLLLYTNNICGLYTDIRMNAQSFSDATNTTTL